MAKDKTIYTCTECGGGSPKWQGKCPSCGAWNTLVEGVAESSSAGRHRFASLAPASEVAALADVTGCPEQLPVMQQWYNGYRFGQVPPHTMYNPWSILNFLSKHPDAPQAYWKNSSDNGLIRTLLMLHAAALGPTVEALLLGQTVQVVVDENVAMPQLHQSPHTVLELLFYSGYLTATDLEPTTAGLRVSLRIPNVEVRYVFTAIFGDWLRQGVLSAGAGGVPSPIGQLTHAMLSGDAEALETGNIVAANAKLFEPLRGFLREHGGSATAR